MSRDGEAVADAAFPGQLENFKIARRKPDHARELRPGETDARQVTGAVDRIRGAQAVAVEIVHPFERIIVEPDRRLRRVPDVDMVGQREIAEPKFQGDLPQGVCQFRLGV
jgi:hypothetical protein